MTEALPPLTAADFVSGLTYNCVNLIEDENGDWVYAYGHIDREKFAAAVNEFDRDMAGPLDWDQQYTAEDVQHLHAVTVNPPPEWYMTWANVDGDTPGAFPITVVSR